MKRPRIQDIAKAAGVSPATVTRALRGSGYASSEKRELVLQAAQELGYDFTQRAESNSIPQVIIFSPFGYSGKYSGKNRLFSDILETLCFEIQKLDWCCLTYYVADDSFDDVVRLLEEPRNLNLKGVIFNCFDFKDNLSAFRKLLISLSIPVVMIERFSDVFGINKIMINAKEAVFLAVRHLYKHGHRKIAFFSPDEVHEVERSRIEGFKSAVSAMELEDGAHYMPIEGYRPECGEQILQVYVEEYGLPTAIVCADPVMVGISRYLYENHIRVPEEISLVSLDDSVASVMMPSLTSVAFPVQEIAWNAIQLLTEEKGEKRLPKTISLSTYLIERNSVSSPRKD